MDGNAGGATPLNDPNKEPAALRSLLGRTNRDWWPNQLAMDILHQQGKSGDPMGDGFNYAEAFKQLDYDAVKRDLHALMHAAEIDMTLWFRGLLDWSLLDLRILDPGIDAPSPLQEAFYDPALRASHADAIAGWLRRYADRLRDDPLPADARRERMRLANPKYVPRNYLAQQAIDRAEAGDTSGIVELLDVLRRPYEDQPGREAFAARRPDWARDRPGCSMLSCSS